MHFQPRRNYSGGQKHIFKLVYSHAKRAFSTMLIVTIKPVAFNVPDVFAN